MQKGFYKNIPKVETLPRKKSISEFDTLLQGVTQSGKTSLLFDYIETLPEESRYLYVDFDEVLNLDIFEDIKNSIVVNSIEYLFIDVYDRDVSKEINSLRVNFKWLKQIIVSSWIIQDLKNFQLLQLYPLSFEEFLVFKNSTESVEHTFLRYTKIGGFPIFAKNSDFFLFKQVKRLLYFALSTFEIEILKDIANNIGRTQTKFQVFNSIKESKKISKDKFYRVFNSLLESNYIVEVKGVSELHKRRFYFIDSALKNSFGNGQNFTKLFENLILSELYKRGIRPNYFGKLDFYIEDSRKGVQPKPFIDEEQVVLYGKSILESTKSLNIERIEIVTMSFDRSFTIDGVEFEAIQFTRWALL